MSTATLTRKELYDLVWATPVYILSLNLDTYLENYKERLVGTFS